VPASDYEVDGVGKFYDIIEEIFEEDGKREINTVAIGDRKRVFGDRPYRNIVVLHVLVRRSQRGNFL
jgi:hypothetical protein